MKRCLTIIALLLTSSETRAIPACEGIDLAELKTKFLSEVHNESDFKAFKPYKWKICARTLGTTIYKEEKDKADKMKEEQTEVAENEEDNKKEDVSNEEEGAEEKNKSEDLSKNDKDKPVDIKKDLSKENENKPEENKEDTKNGEENMPEKNKFSVNETAIAHHFLRQVYPRYPSP